MLENDYALRKWVTRSLLQMMDEDAIIQTLIQKGFTAAYAAQLIDESAPHVEAAISMVVDLNQSLNRQLKKRDWLLDVLKSVSESSQFAHQVEYRDNLSQDEFLECYYSANRPVVITDAMKNWTAMDKWTPEYLESQFGNQMVEVQMDREHDPWYEHNAHRYKQQTRFADFIQQVMQTHSDNPSNNFYMTGNNMEANHVIMQELFQDIEVFPEYLHLNAQGPSWYFWFGPAGTVTKLHHDICNGFLCQVRGRKQIKLVSPFHLPNLYHHLNFYSRVDMDQPDPKQFPLFQNVKVTELILEPGQALFIPVLWWHYVRALDVSISVSFNNFKFPNHYPTFYSVTGEEPKAVNTHENVETARY